MNIEGTTDTETLGLAGAIYKRLYEITGEISDLKKSLKYYQRGFYIANDYYTGVNTAFILTLMSSLSDDAERMAYSKMAEMVRSEVLAICTSMMKMKDANKRDDYTWILQTKAECEFGLGKIREYETTVQFIEMLPNSQFNRSSFDEQMEKLKALIR